MNVSVFSSRNELRFSVYSSIVVTRMTLDSGSRRNQSPVVRQSSSTAVAAETLRRKMETVLFFAAFSLAEMFTPVWSEMRRSSFSSGTSVASR